MKEEEKERPSFKKTGQVKVKKVAGHFYKIGDHEDDDKEFAVDDLVERSKLGDTKEVYIYDDKE